MRVELRIFKHDRHLLLICESEQESKYLDIILSSEVPTTFVATRQLADGYGEDYIRIEETENANDGRKKRPIPQSTAEDVRGASC